jgi:hypothetical protein
MYRRTNTTPTLHTPQTRRGAPGHLARLPMQTRVAFLAALASLALGTLLALPTARHAQAAPVIAHVPSCNGPCIGITNPNDFTQGQAPVAEGPVGAILTIEGANWPPNTLVSVWPAPDAATCATQLAQPPGYAGQINPPVLSDGTLKGTYVWPSAANNVNQSYVLCAVDGTASNVTTTQSNGVDAYTVLAANPPSVSVTPTAITQGQDTMLSITGQNWVPQQVLNVTVCSDITNCQATAVTSQSTASSQTGVFQTSLTLQGDTKPGSYFVQVVSQNQALVAPPAGTGAQLTVSAPTPTPTPTPSPSPTPTPTPTPTPPAKGGSSPLLILLLGTLSLLFLIGGIISIAIYTRGSP